MLFLLTFLLSGRHLTQQILQKYASFVDYNYPLLKNG